VHLAPTSALVPAYLAPSPSLPPLEITFDDGSDDPVAMLLPAIQKVREAAVHGAGGATPTHAAGTLSILLDATATLAGGVRVAAGDLNGDGLDAAPAMPAFVVGTHPPGSAPGPRAAMADGFVSPSGFSMARFATGDGSLVFAGAELANPYLLGRWQAVGATMNLVVDVRTSGAAIMRFRIPRVDPASTSAPAHVRVIDGTMSHANTGDAERAMFDGYPAFTSDALDQVGRVFADYANAASMSLAIAKWTGARPQALTDIIVGTGPGGAAGYEAMACAAALPTAIAVANGLIDLSKDENASAATTVIEAATSIVPKVGLVAGGSLAMQTYGAPAPAGDAELACAAVHQLASLPDTLGSAEGKTIRALSVELAAFDARRLEIEIAAWIAAMDALVLAPDETQWAAARAKADILIEALGNAGTRTEARWLLAKTMLGR
jgi:hypothetical protein